MTRLLCGIAMATLGMATAVPLTQRSGAAEARFEAASIKPVPADAALSPLAGTTSQGNRFSATNATLLMLLRSAYGRETGLSGGSTGQSRAGDRHSRGDHRPSGKVAGAKVLRSIPALDEAALEAAASPLRRDWPALRFRG